LPVCSYSRDATAPGCDTIVSNAGFSKDARGWQAEPLAITVGWQQADADGSPDSGSISVLNSMHGTVDGIAPGAGMQCLAASAGEIFDMAGDIYVPDGQGDGLPGGPYVGKAGLSILFWPTENCADNLPSKGNSQTELVQEVGAWTHVQGSAIAPDGTLSMSVRVLTVKPFKEFNFNALFDNVLLQRR
jgi:hypothetical protein